MAKICCITTGEIFSPRVSIGILNIQSKIGLHFALRNYIQTHFRSNVCAICSPIHIGSFVDELKVFPVAKCGSIGLHFAARNHYL